MPSSVISAVGSALVGKAVGSLLGGGSAKGTNPSSKTLSQYLIPEDLKPDYENLLEASRDLFAKPFTAYTDPRIAEFNTDQLNSFQGIRDLQGRYSPLFDTASQLAMQSASQYQQGITPEMIQQFMNPYQQNVIDISKRESLRDFDKSLVGLRGKYASAGAFGGTRQALAEQELYRNTAQGLDDLQYRGLADSYNQALGAAFRNREGLMQSSQNLAGIAGLGQQYALKDITALGAAGDAQQARDQSLLDFDFAEFARELEYEPQRINQFNSFLQGWMPRQGQMTKDPGMPSPLAQAAGLGSIFAGSGMMNGLTQGLGNVFGNVGFGIQSMMQGNGFGAGFGVSNDLNNLFASSPNLFKDGGLIPLTYADGGAIPKPLRPYVQNFIAENTSPSFADRLKTALSYDNGLYRPIGRGIDFNPMKPDTEFESDVAGFGSGIKGIFKKGFVDPYAETAMGLEVLADDAMTGLGNYFGGRKDESLDDLLHKDVGQYKLGGRGNKGPVSRPAKVYDEEFGPGLPSLAEMEASMADEEEVPKEVKNADGKNKALMQLGIGLLSTPGHFVFGLAEGMKNYAEQLDKDENMQMKREIMQQEAAQRQIQNQIAMRELANQEKSTDATIEHKRVTEALEQYKLAEQERNNVQKNLKDVFTNLNKMASDGMADPTLVQLHVDEGEKLLREQARDRVLRGENKAIVIADVIRMQEQLKAYRDSLSKLAKPEDD
jgi:hypothetical protein